MRLLPPESGSSFQLALCREVHLPTICLAMPSHNENDWLVADSEDEDSFSFDRSLDLDLSKESGEHLPFPA